MSKRTVFTDLKELGHDMDFDAKPVKGFEPTHYEPGTKEKMEVLCERLSKGLPLFHPDDNDRQSIPDKGAYVQARAKIHMREFPIKVTWKRTVLEDS